MAEASSDCAGCILSNTVEPYQAHLILCDAKSPTEWADRVESDPSVEAFRRAVDEFVTSINTDRSQIKLTCCSYVPEIDDPSFDRATMVSVIVYPSGNILSFEPTEQKIASVLHGLYEVVIANACRVPLEVALEAVCSQHNIIVSPVPWEILLLVCCHAARDKRCGRAGPQVMQSLEDAKTELGASHVKVLPSSHIGGHKFAGTLVAYPSGHWYGHLSKSNSKELLISILANDTPIVKCFRGRGFAHLEF